MSESDRKRASLYKIVAALTTIVVLRATPVPATPSAPASRYASIVIDAETGAVLYERNADLARHPASLTKIMTLYLAFEALATKKLTLNDELPISAHAAGRDPSRLDLAPGSKLKCEDAIRAITTKSANDAACAVGEALGDGSEKRFAQRMTAKAKALGLTKTTFLNASGLPEEGQMTSARDLALLCRAMVLKYPDYYRYFSTDTFEFHGTRFHNQNRLLRTYYGADGIKTGFVNASGHNLAASAVRGGKRLIAIVLGGDTQGWTREHATRLLDVSYAKIDPSLVMVASNATTSDSDESEESAPAAEVVQVASIAPTPAAPVPAPVVAASLPAPLPLPNATANLAAFVAAASTPKIPASSVAAVVAGAAAVTSLPKAPAATTTVVSAPPANEPAPAPNAGPARQPQPATTAVAAHTTASGEPSRTVEKPQSAPSSAPGAASPTEAQPPVPVPAGVASAPAAAPVQADNPATVSAAPAPAAPTSIMKLLAQRSAQSPPAGQASTPTLTPVAAPPKSTSEGPQPADAVTIPSATPANESNASAPAVETVSSTNIATGGEWSVQVGLFRDATVARRRGEEARRQMPLQLRGADLVVGRALDGVHVTSRLSRLSEQDARTACNELQRGRVPCVVVPPGRPLIVATN